MSNALITITAIAAAAAITAGLLALEGAGNRESRDERTNRMADQFAVDIVQTDPSFCDPIGDAEPYDDFLSNANYIDVTGRGLSDTERLQFGNRVLRTLERLCGEIGR